MNKIILAIGLIVSLFFLAEWYKEILLFGKNNSKSQTTKRAILLKKFSASAKQSSSTFILELPHEERLLILPKIPKQIAHHFSVQDLLLLNYSKKNNGFEISGKSTLYRKEWKKVLGGITLLLTYLFYLYFKLRN